MAGLCVACVPTEEKRRGPVPQTPEELFHIGQVSAAQGNYFRAEQYMSLGLKTGYDDPSGIHQLLEVCMNASFLRAGINHARWYLTKKPQDMSVRLSLAALLFGVGDMDQATAELRPVLEANPERAMAHYLSGAIAASQGHDGRQRAREHWEKYLELAPDGSRAIEVQMKLREIRDEPKRAEYPSVQSLDEKPETSENAP